jgi:hypothetical protein
MGNTSMINILISGFLVIVCVNAVPSSQIKRSASDWFQSGLEKAGNKDFYGAVEDISKAIELKLGFAKAYYHRGIAYLKYNRKSKTQSAVYKEKAWEDFMTARELGFIVEQK